MSARMSMIFSQNGGVSNKVVMRNAPVAVPVPVIAPVATTARSVNPPPRPRSTLVGLMATSSRSAPKSVKQLFNLGDIMANPGTPCKACGA